MATLTATVGSTTITLADTSTSGNTYRMRSATGMAGVFVRRVTSRGPAQNGETDLGYRLEPRDLELVIGFRATTDAILDGYRDQLMSVFKPLPTTPINLKYTRDDGGVRQLDVYTRGELQIELVAGHRPGHYHEATIPLRNAPAVYYDPTPGTVSVTGAAGTAADWYLAGGAIGTAQVMMSGGTPAQGATWSYAGSIPHTTGWTLAMRATRETLTAGTTYAFYVDNSEGFSGEMDVNMLQGSVTDYSPNYYAGTPIPLYPLGTAFMATGIANYYVRHDANGIDVGYGVDPAVKDAYHRGLDTYVTPVFSAYRPIGGTARRWRSDATNTAASRWGGTVYLYALYSPALSYAQMAALDVYMAGGIGGTTYTYLVLPYAGDLPDYPEISITGPISSPGIFNNSTGELLSFSTVTIGAGTTYVIDTRPGYQTVLQGAVNKRPELDAWSDLGTWHITPDTASGNNVVYLSGTATSGATKLQIVYRNRYQSF